MYLSLLFLVVVLGFLANSIFTVLAATFMCAWYIVSDVLRLLESDYSRADTQRVIPIDTAGFIFGRAVAVRTITDDLPLF